jgi:hypothetical protein
MSPENEPRDRVRIWVDAKSDLQHSKDELDQMADLLGNIAREITQQRDELVVEGSIKKPLYRYPRDFDNLPAKEDLLAKYAAYADAKLRESVARRSLTAKEKRVLELE